MSRIHTTSSGHKFHVGGRHRPIATPQSHPHLFQSVRKYMGQALPAAPSSFNYFSQSSSAQSDILGNNSLGDCTAAGACHLVESVTAMAGAPVILQTSDAIKFYSLSTGYVPGNPSTDQGGDEVTVCTTWAQKGIDGSGTHAIVGWLIVDPTDAVLVKSCMYVFETLYFGLELDSSWPSSVSGNGFVWSGGTPDPNDGHCVVGGGADTNGITINSWGFIGSITYPTIARYCSDSAGGNLFAILTQETLIRAQAKTPNGFDWTTMLADFQAMNGTAPSTTPTLPPPPTPTPSTPVPNPPSQPPPSMAPGKR